MNVRAIPAFSRLREKRSRTSRISFRQREPSYDFNQQRLFLSLPQATMKHRSRGYVPQCQWDDSIPAALPGIQSVGRPGTSSAWRRTTSSYLSLRNGINLGAWRLRNTSAQTTTTRAATIFSRKVAG